VWVAASQAGMVVDPARQRRCGHLGWLPLDAAGLAAKQAVRQYTRAGLQPPQAVRQEWRRAVRRARKRKQEHVYQQTLQSLRDRPKAFWQNYAPPRESTHAVMSAQQWAAFYRSKFATMPPTHPPGPVPDLPSTPDHPLVAPFSEDDLLLAFKKLKTGTAPGVDGIPIAFLTRTALRDSGGQQRHVLAQPLLGVLNLVVSQADMPNVWKHKMLVPVYKRGGRDDPANYRPIAVSTSLYRLFVCMLGARLIDFVENEQCLQQFQFGFRPNLSTHHAHLMVSTCCDVARANRTPLVILKLDIKGAYDTVLRHKLWHEMVALGLPTGLVALVAELYRSAQYVVRANGTHSLPFDSVIGLMQGCALSPVLYNLYCARAYGRVQQAVESLGIPVQHVVNVHGIYADDVAAFLRGFQAIPIYLAAFVAAFASLNQHLCIPKCGALPVGTVSRGEVQEGHLLHSVRVVFSMVLLGVLYTCAGTAYQSLQDRRHKAASKNGLVFHRLQRIGCQRDARIAGMLTRMDVLPTLLYGACIWGAPTLGTPRAAMEHPMQAVLSVIPRTAMQLPASTGHWIVCLLSGVLPVQYHIARCFIRFWNRLCDGDGGTMVTDACVDAQLDLMRRRKPCWLKSWVRAFDKLLPDSHIADTLVLGLALDEQSILDSLEHQYTSVLQRCGDHRVVACPNRRTSFVFGVVNSNLGRVPDFDCWRLPMALRRPWWQFASAQAPLPVHALRQRRVPYGARLCTKCGSGVVGDETHAILHCPATQSIRSAYSPALSFRAGMTLDTFLDVNRKVVDLPYFVVDILGVFSA
jgi:hypothetical protein